MGQDMKENGILPLIKEKDKDIKSGLMDLYMRVTGKMIKLMAEAD